MNDCIQTTMYDDGDDEERGLLNNDHERSEVMRTRRTQSVLYNNGHSQCPIKLMKIVGVLFFVMVTAYLFHRVQEPWFKLDPLGKMDQSQWINPSGPIPT